MKKDNINENEIDHKEESLEVSTKEEVANSTEENLAEKSEGKTTDIKYELVNDEHKNKSSFKNIAANIFDQIIIIAGSGLILLLFDFLIRKIGYMVAIPSAVLLIIYAIINCIYVPIMEKTKAKKTFGQKILNVK